MIISNVKTVAGNDLGGYCWTRISKFMNAEHTASVIESLHQPDKKQKQNVRSQAVQIRHCLLQAREYFKAAETVSIATKPVLLYYGVMSMALAEILLKQSGDSRLHLLREQHPAHGLSLVVQSSPKPEDPLAASLSGLVAKSQVDGKLKPMGTFAVWMRSAREYPIGGKLTTALPRGSFTGFRALLAGEDNPPKPISKAGISLKDCLVELPYMADALGHEVPMNVVRATVVAAKNLEGKINASVTLHPQSQQALDKFSNAVMYSANSINTVEFIEFHSGYAINIHDLYDGEQMILPSVICMDEKILFFSCSRDALNEFGNLYVALHICGNFARYYPDIWLNHVERSSSLALAIEELCTHATERLPLLLLSELTRLYHVVAQ